MSTKTCLRCGHTWYPRYAIRAKQCPKCKSPYWDIPRKSTQIAEQVRSETPLITTRKAGVTCNTPRCHRIGKCCCNGGDDI